MTAHLRYFLADGSVPKAKTSKKSSNSSTAAPADLGFYNPGAEGITFPTFPLNKPLKNFKIPKVAEESREGKDEFR